MKINLGMIMLLLLSLTACTMHVVDFSVISTKELLLENKEAPVLKGEDCTDVYFFSPNTPNINKAIDYALNNDNADYLTDVKIYRHMEYYFFWGKDCFVVEGKSGKLKKKKKESILEN